MHKIKKTLAPIALISLLLSGLAPLPAIAEDKIFQLSKTGSKIYVNDTDDPIFDVNFSGYALDEENRNYRMVVFDNHNGVISKITTCAYDSCEFYLSSEVDFVADGVHQYFAVLDESVSEQDFRVEDEQITSLEDLDNPLYNSDTMFLIAQESKVSISANTSFFSNELIDAFGDEAYPALRMTFSEPVIGDEYFYYTFDITNDKLVGVDSYNEDGWAVYLDTNMNNDSISYQTFMAKSENSETVKTQSDLIDIKQISNAVTLNRRPWIYQATDELAGGVVVEDIAGGGDKTTYLSDQATGKILWSSQDNLPSYSVGNNGYPEWDISWATFSAADPWVGTKPTNISELTGIVANNRDLKDLPKKPGLESKEQVAGGYNPSEFCQQTCGGDPINFYTGEFFEDATDLSFSGKGLTPQASRSFSTQKKDELGAMGYGWRSTYSMSIKSATSESLEDTKRVKIVQENGSVSFFDKNLDGTYSAGLNVKATLARNPNGELVFTRDKRTIFTFTSQGSLVKVADLNGNFLNLGYSNGNLSTVSDNRSNIITYVYNADNLTSKVTANNGRSVTYAYNAKRLVKVTDESGVITDYTYDTKRRVKTLNNALGGVTENFYDTSHRVIRQDDAYDKRLRLSYGYDDGLNQETTITYPDGRIAIESYQDGALTQKTENLDTALEKRWNYSYDSDNQLISTVNPDGSNTGSVYDSQGNIVKYRNELGGESTFTYDSMGNILTATNPLGKATTNTYDVRGNITSATDPMGNKTSYEWDSLGLLVSIIDARGNKTDANPEEYKTVLAYTGKGLIASTTNALDDVYSTRYDSFGRSTSIALPKGNATSTLNDYTINTSYSNLDLPAQITDQKGNKTNYVYDNSGNILTSTDPMGNVTTNTYDLMGRILTSTTDDGTTSYTYNAVGRIVSATDAGGNITIYNYNKSGDMTKITDPKLNVTTMTYDKMGRVITVKNAINSITKIRYDAAGHRTLLEDALGNFSGTTYSKSGQVTSTFDNEKIFTKFEYDDNGRLEKTILADNSFTTQSYDEVGNIVSRTNGEGDTETWGYDSLNRATSYTDQEGKLESYAYDSHSNVMTTTLEDGSIIGTDYDEKDLPTLIDYAGTTKDTEFTYNSLDLVTKEKVGVKETNTTYDHAGRILTRNGVIYEYDALGNQEKITYPSGRIVDYTYDANKNLVSAVSSDIGTIMYTYDKRNLLISTTLPNGVTETRTQDSLARTTNISIANTTQELHAVSKAYSPNSNLTTSKYGVGSSIQSESYEHDELNRTTGVNSTINNATGSNAYNKANHLTTFEGEPVISDKIGKPLTIGVTEFTYGDLGQRISEGTEAGQTPEKEFLWNIDGTLNEATNKLSTVAYGYSTSGLLDERSSNGVSKNFAWDENAANALMLSDGDYEYVYGATRVPIAQVELATGNVEYLHSDVNGSVIAVTTEVGVLAGVTNYGAYGKRLGSAISRFGYAGEWTDPETTYTYLRARWYDASMGSFLSKDPLYQSTSEAYGYAGGNPLVRIDPSGLAYVGEDYEIPWHHQAWLKTDRNFVESTANIFGGIGNSLLFGAGTPLRAALGLENAVDECSTEYKTATIVTDVAGMATGVGAVKGAAKGALSLSRKSFNGFNIKNLMVKSNNSEFGGAAIPFIAAKKWNLEKKAIKVAASGNRKYYKQKPNRNKESLWWSKDSDEHGGSMLKVFKETSKGLEWISDADEYGNFITGKHKGPQGKFIPWKILNTKN